MATISIIRHDTASGEGRQPIYLLLSDRGKRKKFATGFTATEDEWYYEEFEKRYRDGRVEKCRKDEGQFNQGRGVKEFLVERKEEDGSLKQYTNKDANEKLAQIKDAAKKMIKRYEDNHVDWSFEMFRNDFRPKPNRNYFYSFAMDFVVKQEYQSKGAYQSANIILDALKSLKRYDSNLEKKMFQDINREYIDKYKNFCRNSWGNSDNTISIRLRAIRRILNLAIDNGVGSPETYPFTRKKSDKEGVVPKYKLNRQDQYLTMDALKALSATTFSSHRLERAKHLFLFSYHCNGINWRDMAELTSSCIQPKMTTDDETGEAYETRVIEYSRSKTGGEFSIEITPMIQKELDWFESQRVKDEDKKDDEGVMDKKKRKPSKKYLLPIIEKEVAPEKKVEYIKTKRKRTNIALKEIAKKLNLPASQLNITIYSARHSFAMSMRKAGSSIDEISQALGHKDTKTTESYLAKFSTSHMTKITSFNLDD